ncbi:MAG: hypothetical protein ACRDI3_00455 [Actinomycetota bacterium]
MRRLIALIAGLTLVACGGSQSSLAVITLAASRTVEAGTARSVMSSTIKIQGQEIRSRGEGEIDFEAQRGRMSMEMSGGPGAAAFGTTELIFDGLVIYMKSPAFSQIPGGKEWVSMDLAAMGDQMGFDMSALQQLGQNDPTASLYYLRGAKEVKEIGEEEVRGEPTTHYEATINFDDAIAKSPEDIQASLRSTLDQMKAWMGKDEMVFDVWLDGDGRMRRQQMTFDYVSGPAAGTSADITIEMFDFGIPVEVSPPPASQVTDLQELIQQQQGDTRKYTSTPNP